MYGCPYAKVSRALHWIFNLVFVFAIFPYVQLEIMHLTKVVFKAFKPRKTKKNVFHFETVMLYLSEG